jgi:GTP-binding protein HflX
VGFIRDLPHGLIDAFAATLTEAVDADVLLHVVDGASPDYLEQIEQVQRVLSEIGAADVPQILVFNKLDAIEKSSLPLHLQDRFELRDPFEGSFRSVERVFVSAKTGEGLNLLRELLAIRATRAPAVDSPQTAH